MAAELWQAGPTPPTTEADRMAVEAAIRDYFDGWFDADAERMARALDPALAKRSVGQDRERRAGLASTSAAEMIEATAAGRGAARGRLGRTYEIRIDEISGGIAAATVQSDAYVEFIHLARLPDGWRIVNTLWRYADGHGPLG